MKSEDLKKKQKKNGLTPIYESWWWWGVVDLLADVTSLSLPSHETLLEPRVSEHAVSCRSCTYVPRPHTHFLQECVGALPVLLSLPTSRLLTRRMWCICSCCALSVVTSLEFCFSHSFEPEEALMASVAAQNSRKQLQKCERTGKRKGIFMSGFFLRASPPSPRNQPRHPPPIHPHF